MLFDVRRTALVADLVSDRRDTEVNGVDGLSDLKKRARQDRTRFRNKHLSQATILTVLFWASTKAIPAAVLPVLPEAINAWQSDLSIFSYTSRQLLSDLVLRIFLVAEFIMNTYMLDSIFHSLFALCFVNILGFDSLEEWPTLWGSIVETTSIRDFWGRFWHKLVQRTLVGLSSYFLRAFGIKSRGAAGRTLIPFLVFLFSGIVHGITTWRLGFRCGWWADIAWFCAQSVVIVLEDVASSSAKRIVGPKLPRSICVLLGYVWVWGFLLCSIPRLQFAKMQCGLESH